MSGIMQDAFAIITLGIVFFASLFLVMNLPPYIVGIERFIFEMIPLVIILLMLYIILYWGDIVARPNEVNGTVAIKFRVSKAVYETLRNAADRAGITMSEFVRGIIYYYLTETLLETVRDENPKTLKELREELKKEVSRFE